MLKSFNAIKYNTYLQKYVKAKGLLNQELDKKADCEQKLAQLVEINKEKTFLQCFRRTYSRYNDLIYSGFQKWREYSSYKFIMVERIYNQLVFKSRTHKMDGFQLWKSLVNRVKINELKVTNAEIIADNTQVARDIKELDSKHKVLKDLKQHIKEMKLERCHNMIFRGFQKYYFKKWINHVTYLERKEYAFNKLAKVERKHLVNAKIVVWRQKVTEQKRFKYIQTFLENHDKYKAISLKTNVFDTLKRYITKQQRVRLNLRRIFQRCKRQILLKSVSRWKCFAHNTRMADIKNHIEELDQKHHVNTHEIAELNEKIETTLFENSQISQKLVVQARRII